MADKRQEYEAFKKRQEYNAYKGRMVSGQVGTGLQPLPSNTFAPPSEKSVSEKPSTFLRDLPYGSIVGGTIGASMGGIPGSIVGAGGGEAAEQLVKRGSNVALGTELDVPKTSMEAAQKIGTEGALAGLGEGVMRGGVTVVNKALKTFSGSVTPAAKEAIDFLKEYIPVKERSVLNPLRYLAGKGKQETMALLPAEATQNRVLDILHNISEASIIGGSRLQDFKLNRVKLFEDISDDIVKSFGELAEPDKVGELFMETVNKNIQPSRLLANSLYNSAEELGRGAEISMVGLKEFARPLAKISENIGGIGGTASGDNLIQAILNMPDNVEYPVAKELRSRLLSVVDEFSIANKKAPAIGKAKKLTSLIDEATEKGLSQYNPKALETWREANKVYREGSEVFDNKFIRRLVKSADPDFGGQPETIAKAIFKPGAVSNIKRAKEALGGLDSSSWRNMQSYYTQSLFSKSTNKSGILLGTDLEANLIGKAGMGEKALNEIYTPAQLAKVKQFANALKVSQTRQSEGTGRMFIQLTQAGAIVQLATGWGDDQHLKPASVAVVLGPYVLSRVFTNPALASALIKGVQGGVKTKVAAGTLGRFLTDITAMEFNKGKQEQGEKD